MEIKVRHTKKGIFKRTKVVEIDYNDLVQLYQFSIEELNILCDKIEVSQEDAIEIVRLKSLCSVLDSLLFNESDDVE